MAPKISKKIPIRHLCWNSNIVSEPHHRKKDRSEGMISRFQECMWKGINSQYIYWIYRLFSSPFKFKKLKEFFLCIRKWCCIVQEIVVVVLYWFVSGESFKRMSPCLKMGTYWWWPNTVSKNRLKWLGYFLTINRLVLSIDCLIWLS